MNKEDGGPAFPIAPIDRGPGNIKTQQEPGMSLRDYFAAAALPELIRCASAVNGISRDYVVGEAFAYADAMLAARQEKR